METTQIPTNEDTTTTGGPAAVRRLARGNGTFGGVVAGIGEHFDLDPTAIRIGLVAVTLLGGFPVVPVAYLAAWPIIPQQSLPAPPPPRTQMWVTSADATPPAEAWV